MKRLAIACLLATACGPALASGGTSYFDRAPTLFDKGMISFELHRYREAAGTFDKVVAANPHDARACYYAALTHQYLGEVDEARHMYKRIVSDFPGTEYASNAHLALQRIGRASFEAPYVGDVRGKMPQPVASEGDSGDNAGQPAAASTDSNPPQPAAAPPDNNPGAATPAATPAAPPTVPPVAP